MPPLCQRYSGDAIVRDDYMGDNSSGGLIRSLYQPLSPPLRRRKASQIKRKIRRGDTIRAVLVLLSVCIYTLLPIISWVLYLLNIRIINGGIWPFGRLALIFDFLPRSADDVTRHVKLRRDIVTVWSSHQPRPATLAC